MDTLLHMALLVAGLVLDRVTPTLGMQRGGVARPLIGKGKSLGAPAPTRSSDPPAPVAALLCFGYATRSAVQSQTLTGNVQFPW